MEPLGEYGLDGSNESGIRMNKEERAALSEIIEVLNKRFSTEFGIVDKLHLDIIEEHAINDEKLGHQARANSLENFKFAFNDVFFDNVISSMDRNMDFSSKILDDNEFGIAVRNYLAQKLYNRFNERV